MKKGLFGFFSGSSDKKKVTNNITNDLVIDYYIIPYADYNTNYTGYIQLPKKGKWLLLGTAGNPFGVNAVINIDGITAYSNPDVSNVSYCSFMRIFETAIDNFYYERIGANITKFIALRLD